MERARGGEGGGIWRVSHDLDFLGGFRAGIREKWKEGKGWREGCGDWRGWRRRVIDDLIVIVNRQGVR